MPLILRSFTEVVELIFALIYAPFLLSISKRPRRVIVYYHTVKKDDVRQFERQIEYIAKNYRVVKASQIRTTAVDSNRPIVAVTFDDAFLCILKNALPMLRRHGLTATIFVPTGNLGRFPKWNIPDNSSDKQEHVMSRQQIAEVHRDGFEVLSHAVSHSALTEVEDPRLASELSESKQVLEEIVGHEICGLSYPYGACNVNVCEAARQAGYRLGFTIKPNIVRSTTDNMQIGRFSVSPKDGLVKFRLKASGAYQVVGCLRKVKAWFLKK